MGYCVSMTRAGYELQAALFAEKAPLVITRVAVGSGTLPEGAVMEEMTDLIVPEAVATSTKPQRVGCDIHLTVEYRSDLNGGLEKAFQIREFGVFALGADGTEILLLYGDLSDHPEPAVPLGSGGGCVRRYPLVITVGPGANAQLRYPAGAWVTWEEMDGLASLLAIRQLGITIPAVGWVKNGGGRYPYRRNVPVEGAAAEMIPFVTVAESSEETAWDCGLAPIAETLEGAVAFRAVTPPKVDIAARLTLMRNSSGLTLGASGLVGGSVNMPIATQEVPGLVKPGARLIVAQDGTLSLDTATDEEVRELLGKEE